MSDLIGPTRARLQKLLKEYNEYPKRQPAIDKRIHDEFVRPWRSWCWTVAASRVRCGSTAS